MTPLDPITIRLATVRDAADLERLAALDSAVAPAGEVLVAEVAGALRAAKSLDTGASVADPFAPTAPLVELLELEAARRTRPDGRRRRRPWTSARPAAVRLGGA